MGITQVRYQDRSALVIIGMIEYVRKSPSRTWLYAIIAILVIALIYLLTRPKHS